MIQSVNDAHVDGKLSSSSSTDTDDEDDNEDDDDDAEVERTVVSLSSDAVDE